MRWSILDADGGSFFDADWQLKEDPKCAFHTKARLSDRRNHHILNTYAAGYFLKMQTSDISVVSSDTKIFRWQLMSIPTGFHPGKEEPQICLTGQKRKWYDYRLFRYVPVYDGRKQEYSTSKHMQFQYVMPCWQIPLFPTINWSIYLLFKNCAFRTSLLFQQTPLECRITPKSASQSLCVNVQMGSIHRFRDPSPLPPKIKSSPATDSCFKQKRQKNIQGSAVSILSPFIRRTPHEQA
jgi:hypothetical protein